MSAVMTTESPESEQNRAQSRRDYLNVTWSAELRERGGRC